MCTFYEKRPELVKQYDELQSTLTDTWSKRRRVQSQRNLFKVAYEARKPILDHLDPKDILGIQEEYDKAMQNFDKLIQAYKDIELRAMLLMQSFDKDRLN